MPPNMRNGKLVTLPLAERLQNKYQIDPATQCWNWKGSLRRGYGYLKSGKTKLSAHRSSWEIHFGKVPSGQWVLHKCDNPKCVNPDHLFLGTALDNNLDMMRKGRAKLRNSGTLRPGEENPGAKLTVAAVHHINRKEMRPTDYAKLYGVSVGNVCSVQAGRAWSHLQPPKENTNVAG